MSGCAAPSISKVHLQISDIDYQGSLRVQPLVRDPTEPTGKASASSKVHRKHRQSGRRLNEAPVPRSFAEPVLIVDAGGLTPNTWKRLERLSSAWEQARLGIGRERPQGAEPESGVVTNPTRRARTPLGPEEVDAIRTARQNGDSVISICRRFDVHRMTVWTHTKDLL